jgi:uncharacterized membrane protein YgcG
MPKYVELTEDEAWAIDHTIRHTYSEGTTNIGRDLLLKVMNVILEFEERRGKPFAPEVLPVALTEDECWAVDHQIRCDLTVNNKPVGRGVLLKVFALLTEYANDRDSESGVEHLGSLADLLRPPPDEEPGGGAGGAGGPGAEGSRGGSGNAGSSGGSGRSKPDSQPRPDDGPAGALPRDK